MTAPDTGGCPLGPTATGTSSWDASRSYLDGTAMAGHVQRSHMTPTRLRERLAESADRVDAEAFVAALEYVRDDGRSRTTDR